MSVQFFTADDGINGRELWITNGTSAGTFLLKDINPGPGDFSVGNFVQSNAVLYFTAYDGASTQLWRSDGSAAGTVKLSSPANGANPSSLTDVNGTLFYIGSDSTNGSGLFKYDADAGAVTFVKAVSSASQFTVVGGKLFFQAFDGTAGSELWSSDGTAGGTSRVADIRPGASGAGLGNLTAAGGKLFFTANDGTHGTELFVSDGTSAGTSLVSDLNLGPNGSDPDGFVTAGGKVFFRADDGVTGRQLYTSDGTTETRLTSGSTPSSFFVVNGKFFFAYNDGTNGSGIYTTDGSTVSFVSSTQFIGAPSYTVGTKLFFQGYNAGYHLFALDGAAGTVTQFSDGGDLNNGAAASGGKLFYSLDDGTNGRELWVTDGTVAGTHLTRDINPGGYASTPTGITFAGPGKVVFAATDPATGREVYVSDGTSAGTTLLADVNATVNLTPSLNPSNVFQAGTLGFFTGDDGVHGRELYATDGTAAGTHLVQDLVVGANGSGPDAFVTAGGKFFFRADDGVTGRQLYTSDGTTETRLTSGSTPSSFFVVNDKFFFAYNDGTNGSGIYTSDGSTVSFVSSTQFIGAPSYTVGTKLFFQGYNAGYHLFALDGTTGTVTSFSDTGDLNNGAAASGGKLFYSLDDGTNGRELWVTDGTTAGTHLTRDINPGGYASTPTGITAFGTGKVIFAATDPAIGREVYVSDGTSAGTTLLADINATTNPGQSISPSNVFQAGTLGFFTGDDGVHGRELYATDGTAAGTHLVQDLVVGANGSGPDAFVTAGGKFFFRADDGVTGRQLYTSDGTTETRLTSGSTPSSFFVVNDKFFFAYNDGTNGSGIYTSDGSTVSFVSSTQFIGAPSYTVGTKLFFQGYNAGYHLFALDGTTGTVTQFSDGGDLNNGAAASGGKLFYSLDDGTNGRELWVTDGTTAGTHLTRDINPGGYASTPTGITAFGTGKVVFAATDPAIGREVYVSDGTSAGTTLLADINATTNPGQSISPSNVFQAGTLGFFTGDDGVHGRELYATDGTAAGTHLVQDLVVGANGSGPDAFVTAGGKFFFRADDGVTGRQLYTSDGTTETRLTSGSTPSSFFVVNDKFFFAYNDGTNGSGIYTSDGSTVSFVSSTQFIGAPSYTVGTKLFFQGYNAGYHLFALDGTTGTVTQFSDGGDLNNGAAASGGKLFYSLDDGTNGRELWVTDGTTAGTHLTRDINPGTAASSPSQITPFGAGVAFVATGASGSELYVSDGNTDTLVKDIAPGATGSNIQQLTAVGSKLFFSANDAAHGQELWVSDGTTTGTFQVKDQVFGTDSFNPDNLRAINGKLYFTAYSQADGRYQIWTSDGTPGNLSTVTTNANGSNVNAGTFTVIGTKLFFLASDDTHGGGLFVLDTATNTTTFLDSRQGNTFGVVGGKLTFAYNDGIHGNELWISDGTVGGTTRITDAGIPNSSDADQFVVAGGLIYFMANDGIHGRELFVSDGTSANTHLLKDIRAGATDLSIDNVNVINDKLYFRAYNETENRNEIWTTNGTEAGTTPLTTSANGSNPYSLTVIGTKIYFLGGDDTHGGGLFVLDTATNTTTFLDSRQGNTFGVVGGKLTFAYNDGTNGNELWISDGTVGGTTRITDAGIPNSSDADQFVVAGGLIYFMANDGIHGRELFVSDGTSANTHLLKDIRAGATDLSIDNVNVINDKLYFRAYNETENRNEIWTTNGTEAGTTPLTTSANGSNPYSLTVIGTKIYFLGGDDTHGGGLFVLDTATNTTTFLDSRQGNTFGVVGGKLTFAYNDGTNGNELWISDGTVGGTTRITDTSIVNSSDPTNFFALTDVAPVLAGTGVTLTATDKVSVNPFATVSVTDADVPAQTQTVTVTVDDPNKGGFTAASLTASGFTTGGVVGTYTFQGTAAQATAALQALVFAPTENRLSVGASETTTFNIVVNDGAGGSTHSNLFTVTATSVNDAPAPVADVVSVNEDATAATVTRAAGVLGNDVDVDVHTSVTVATGNLIVNPGAELGPSAHDFTTTQAPQGWTVTGAFSEVDYSAIGQNALNTPPSGGGVHYFAGGPTAGVSTATQTIDVSAYTAGIDAGVVVASLGGLFGGYTTQDDQLDMRVRFLNASGQEISTSAPIGDVTAADRGNVTELLSRAATVGVPAGTRSIQVILTATGGNGAYNDGYADNLSLSLSTVRETVDLRVSGAHFGTAADSTVAADNSATVVQGTYGALTIHADGTYSYTPNTGTAEALPLNAPATESFSYTVLDPHGAATASTLTFNITGQNDAPVAVADIGSAGENQTKTFDLVANDSEIDTGDTKTLLPLGAITVASSNGQVNGIDATSAFSVVNNKLQFTPGTLFDHLAAADSATVTVAYTVQDGPLATSSSSLTLTVQGANDAPVAVADTGTAGENETKTFDLLANDVEVDTGDTKTLASIGTVTVASSNGQVNSIDASTAFSIVNNQLKFTPGTLFDHLAVGDTATVTVGYTVRDGQSASSSAALTLTVTGANDAPVAVADTVSATEAGGVANGSAGVNPVANLLANDIDVDTGDIKTVSAVSYNGSPGAVGTPLSGAHGAFNVLADGTYAYTVNQSDTAVQALRTFADTLTDTFAYTVRDNHNATSSSTITVTLHGADDNPVANPDTGVVGENETKTFDLLVNDTDVDANDTKTLAAIGAVTVASSNGQVNSIDASTAFSIVNGQLKFTPGTLFDHLNVNESATVTVGYTVQDTALATAASTLTLTVQGADDAPTAVADAASVVERLTVTGAVLANDSDVDTGDTRTVSALANGLGTVPVGAGGVVIGGAYGLINLLQDGTYTYLANKEGLAVGQTVVDTFTYTVTDSHGVSAAATLAISVTGSPTGDGGDNIIVGSAGADTLDGQGGADVLIGGGGADTLTGGAGADRFTYTSLNDSRVGAGDFITDFQSGHDVIDLSAVDGGNVALSFDGTTSYVAFGQPTASGFPDAIQVHGQVHASDLALSAGTGVALYGSSGADTLVGAGQADFIIGGGGADVLTGGAGRDTFYYASTGDSLMSGRDLITDFQTGVDTIDLSAADGGYAAIAYDGGASYVAFGAPDASGFPAGIGVVGTVTGADLKLSANAHLALFGSAGSDTLIGGGGADLLLGGDGADTLTGGGGADTLTGGAGADVFLYTSLNDSLLTAPDFITDFQSGQDVINIAAVDGGYAALAYDGSISYVAFGQPTAAGFQDVVLVQGRVQATDLQLSANATLSLYGSSGADTLAGGAEADFIIGGAGADVLTGGAGKDIFYYGSLNDSLVGSGDRITDFQSGQDVIDLSAVDGGYVALSYSGGASYVAFGAPTASGYPDVVVVQGTVLVSDLKLSSPTVGVALYGTAAVDTLIGGSGADTIAGGGGADTLTGGAGADTFYYGSLFDSPTLTPDTITDFQTGLDKIDLRSVHTGVGDKYSFHAQGADMVLQVDLGGDGVNDMQILLTGVSSLSNHDILF